jgi:stearoyl-CoA desaturase (delta-9 desaturase)
MITEDVSTPPVNYLIRQDESVGAIGARSTTNEPQSRSPRSIFRRFPIERINWMTSSFLMGTLALTLTAVPLYLWYFGLDRFQVALFLVLAATTGFSITLGYHRLFTHMTFQASWPIRLFTVLFGAASFENSVVMWASEHRRHHKFVDHDHDDPYSISKGFWYAHIGWLLFKVKPDPPFDNVADLQKDPLVRWQHRHINLLAVVMSFVLPPLLGAIWNGWRGALGAFLLAGVARVVVVQHGTFLINSACHYMGRQPYSKKCSARDSWLMALFTLGEGYHNYHHEFQYDYRNGVRPWHVDPTKWMIWTLSKLGLVRNLRRASPEKIRAAQAEASRSR